MEGYFTPQIIIPALIVLALFAGWHFWNKYKHKGQKTTTKAKDGSIDYKPVDAIIYDRTTVPFTWYEANLAPSIVEAIVTAKKLSRQVTFNGKKVFRFYKLPGADGAVSYEGVTEPSNVKNSPITAYIDMQHPYVSVLDDMTPDRNFMQKYGHLLIWLGVIAFIIFMVISNK